MCHSFFTPVLKFVEEINVGDAPLLLESASGKKHVQSGVFAKIKVELGENTSENIT